MNPDRRTLLKDSLAAAIVSLLPGREAEAVAAAMRPCTVELLDADGRAVLRREMVDPRARLDDITFDAPDGLHIEGLAVRDHGIAVLPDPLLLGGNCFPLEANGGDTITVVWPRRADGTPILYRIGRWIGL